MNARIAKRLRAIAQLSGSDSRILKRHYKSIDANNLPSRSRILRLKQIEKGLYE